MRSTLIILLLVIAVVVAAVFFFWNSSQTGNEVGGADFASPCAHYGPGMRKVSEPGNVDIDFCVSLEPEPAG